MANKQRPQIDYESALKDNGMPITPDEINQQFNDIVKEEQLITNTSTMSPFWRLISSIVTTPVQWLKDVLIQLVFTNMYLATATETWLEMFAWGVNLQRKPATKAKGQIRFYRASNQESATVPAGTVVQTERINGQTYHVITTETVTINKESALIAVDANEAGGAFNLAPGYFRILPVAIPGIERAQNEENWLLVPGADKESDDDLRDRCRNQYNLVGNYHTDAVYQGMIASVVGLSIDRIFFLHDAPRGPGTANAYLLLDSGVISQPFIDKVNDYVNTQGHYGHGDDMQCLPMPETHHDINLKVYVENLANLTTNERMKLQQDIENLIGCAFRENTSYDVKKTWPYARFSFSNLSREIHRHFALVDSLQFNQIDIISELSVPRLKSLTVELYDA